MEAWGSLEFENQPPCVLTQQPSHRKIEIEEWFWALYRYTWTGRIQKMKPHGHNIWDNKIILHIWWWRLQDYTKEFLNMCSLHTSLLSTIIWNKLRGISPECINKNCVSMNPFLSMQHTHFGPHFEYRSHSNSCVKIGPELGTWKLHTSMLNLYRKWSLTGPQENLFLLTTPSH